MTTESESLGRIAAALAYALADTEVGQVHIHESTAFSCVDGVHVCAALPFASDATALSKSLLAMQLAEPESYGVFQVALDRAMRVCVLWRPASVQSTQADCIATMLDRMLSFVHFAARR